MFFLPQYGSLGHAHAIGLHSNSNLSALFWTVLTFKSFFFSWTPLYCDLQHIAAPREPPNLSPANTRASLSGDAPSAPRDKLAVQPRARRPALGVGPGPSEAPPSPPSPLRELPALPPHDQRCPGCGNRGRARGVFRLSGRRRRRRRREPFLCVDGADARPPALASLFLSPITPLDFGALKTTNRVG